jgi:dihydroxynaphthoic acid synthetase
LVILINKGTFQLKKLGKGGKDMIEKSSIEYEDIIYTKKNGVATITINRPKVYNALRTETHKEIVYALRDCALDDSIGVVVITGAGDKAFTSGGDLNESKQPGAYRRDNLYWHSEMFHCIRKTPQPVIAAVNGYAIGAGNITAFLCDLTIASENARFGQTGPRVGSTGGGGFNTAYLIRVVGEKKAREMWFLCRQYTAQEAYEMGLVNKVVPLDKLQEEVDQICKEILALGPLAIRLCKMGFNAASERLSGDEGLSEIATRLYWWSPEAQELRTSFAEKRGPDWSKLPDWSKFR